MAGLVALPANVVPRAATGASRPAPATPQLSAQVSAPEICHAWGTARETAAGMAPQLGNSHPEYISAGNSFWGCRLPCFPQQRFARERRPNYCASFHICEGLTQFLPWPFCRNDLHFLTGLSELSNAGNYRFPSSTDIESCRAERDAVTRAWVAPRIWGRFTFERKGLNILPHPHIKFFKTRQERHSGTCGLTDLCLLCCPGKMPPGEERRSKFLGNF